MPRSANHTDAPSPATDGVQDLVLLLARQPDLRKFTARLQRFGEVMAHHGDHADAAALLSPDIWPQLDVALFLGIVEGVPPGTRLTEFTLDGACNVVPGLWELLAQVAAPLPQGAGSTGAEADTAWRSAPRRDHGGLRRSGR
jgi:hypothetical protein